MAAEGQLLCMEKVNFWSLLEPGAESDIYDCLVLIMEGPRPPKYVQAPPVDLLSHCIHTGA